MRHRALLAVTVFSFGSVGLALVLQHGFDIQPCAWCTLQRLIYLAIGLAALGAWLTRIRAAERLLVLLGIALSVSGMAAALYQQFVAAKSQSCVQSLADRIIKTPRLDEIAPWLFKATAFCDEANVPLLGVPFAFWSVALFAVLLALLMSSLLRSRRHDRYRSLL